MTASFSKGFMALTAVALLLATPSSADAREKTRSGTYQGAHASGTATQKITREKGAVTRQTEWQGSNGGSGSSTYNRTGNTSSRVTTNAQGQTATTNTTYTKTDDGYTASSSRTGYNGNTQTITKDVTKTEDGHSASSTITNQNGKTVTRDTNFQHSDGTWSRDMTQTGENGRVVKRSQTGTYSNTNP